jgi:hypothetical protein
MCVVGGGGVRQVESRGGVRLVQSGHACCLQPALAVLL